VLQNTVLTLCLVVLAGCAPHARSAVRPVAGATPEGALTSHVGQAGGAMEGTPTAEETDAARRQADWLQAAHLGPYAGSLQDWELILDEARREGKVTVYSSSSRIKHAAEEFAARYPEIQVEALDVGTKDAILALQHEQSTADHRCDVYFAGSAPVLHQELLVEGLAWTFVPDGALGALPDKYRSPLVQRLSLDVVIYNSDTYEAPPIDNWWDLTRPEWKAKTVMRDPAHLPDGMHLFVAMTQHPEQMALAYETEFGEPMHLAEECDNAGYQWIRDFLAAEPVFLPGAIEVAEAVGSADQFDPPIGICPYAQYSKVIRHNLYFEPLFDLSPFSGIASSTCLAIANRAPHPNAAKLMIRWLMGDPTQDRVGGFAPWWTLGEYSPRADIPDPEHSHPWSEVAASLWPLDNRLAHGEVDRVRSFWLNHLH